MQGETQHDIWQYDRLLYEFPDKVAESKLKHGRRCCEKARASFHQCIYQMSASTAINTTMHPMNPREMPQFIAQALLVGTEGAMLSNSGFRLSELSGRGACVAGNVVLWLSDLSGLGACTAGNSVLLSVEYVEQVAVAVVATPRSTLNWDSTYKK